MCLVFTGAGVGRADPERLYVEDPYAPHETSGTTARLGTSVGYIHVPSGQEHLSTTDQQSDVLGLGVTAGVGQRWNRFAVESEYTFLGFQVLGPASTHLGQGHRLGVIGRFDVLRFGSHTVGQNSMAAIYVEGGAAVAWNHWFRPAYNEAARVVLDDTKRVETQVGFGIMLDHRLQEPIGFPRRVGWFLGWRVAMSPHQEVTGSVCRGVACRPVTMMQEDKLIDRSMLFQSSLQFTF